MKTPEVKLPKTLPERDALVAAAKDMNQILALDPAIKTKKLTDEELATQVYIYAKGFDEETGEYNPEFAVSYEDKVSRKLAAETFEVLIALGAVEPKKEKVKEKKAKLEDDDTVKEKKASTGTRNKGIRLTNWDTLSKQLKAVDPTKEKCMATIWDHLLMSKMTGKERNDRCAELGVKPIPAGHIAWRLGQGYLMTDLRKHKKDLSAKVYFTGFDAEAKGAVKEFDEEPPAPEKPKKEKKEKKSARIEEEAEEAPVKKVKKAKKEEAVEEEATEEAPVKKSKKDKISKKA